MKTKAGGTTYPRYKGISICLKLAGFLIPLLSIIAGWYIAGTDNDKLYQMSNIVFLLILIVCFNLTGILLMQIKFLNKKQKIIESLTILAIFTLELIIWILAHMVIAV